MSSDTKVMCTTHGEHDETFVCQHIAQSLHTGIPAGFFWSAESRQQYPDAWCAKCEQARINAGGEWTPEVETELGIKLLCAECYENAKHIWQNVQ